MIQPKGKLCFAAMKLAQWPTLTLGVSRVLWPGRLKGQSISSTTYSCTSTVVQAQKSTKDETAQGSSKAVSSSDFRQSEQHSNANPPVGKPFVKSDIKTNVIPRISESKPEPTEKELVAVMKVKSLSEALEVCSAFNPLECLAALKNLAAANSRPLPLIQNLSKGMSSSLDRFSLKELSDVLFCLSKFNFADEDLLSKTCGALTTGIKQSRNAPVLGSSITSLRRLQWKDPNLLDELSTWILNNFNKFQNPSNFIYTLALQNHSPKNLDELLPLVWKDINNNMYGPVTTVNFLWSLSVLNSNSSKEILRKNVPELFKSNFWVNLDHSPHMIPVWIKLCNLHGVAKSFLNSTQNLSLPEDINNKIMEFSMKNEKVIMVSEVKEVLFKDMENNLYSTFVPTTMGFSIDLMCNLDDQMRAVPVNLNAPSCTRVAVMIHSYHECCQPTKEPNGFRSLEMRLLERNLKVISLPYHILAGGHAKVYGYFESALKDVTKKKKN